MSELEHPKRGFVKTKTILKTTFNITKIIGESSFTCIKKNIQNTYHIIMLLFQNAFKGWTSFIFLFVGWRRSHFSFGIYWLQIHATAASTVEHRLRAWKCQPFDTKDENFRLGQMVLLVEEILHQLRSVLYPHYNNQVLYIPGGSGFLSSTVP